MYGVLYEQHEMRFPAYSAALQDDGSTLLVEVWSESGSTRLKFGVSREGEVWVEAERNKIRKRVPIYGPEERTEGEPR